MYSGYKYNHFSMKKKTHLVLNVFSYFIKKKA